MSKKELEFHDPKLDGQWRRPEGYPEGITELIITQCPESHVFTRFLKFEPGVKSTNTLSHECWEEVYIIYGDLSANGHTYTEGMVAVRPPHMPHGPFSSEKGCMTFEVHYESKQEA